jgi:diadenosine tetraphosphate (Ap4A) HIT family hydrolase
MSGEVAGEKVYEDDEIVAFRTIAPSTSRHVLVCPRKHVADVDSLSGPSGVRLMKQLVAVGKKYVGDEDAQFSFHLPPWNSIDHLHLHAIGRRREMSWKARLKFWEGSHDWCKSAAACIDELERPPAADDSALPPKPS